MNGDEALDLQGGTFSWRVPGWRPATPDEIAQWIETGRVDGGRCRIVAGVGLMVPA